MAFKRFAIFASGNGTNAKNLIEHWKKTKGDYSIDLVVTDNPNAPVIQKVEALGVKCLVVTINRKHFENFADAKKDYEERLLNILKEHQVNWLLLAGYMKLLGDEFLSEFADVDLGINRVVNVHPSLLPSFKGKDGLKDAFDYGVKVSGITIHFVDNEVDTGPIILQKTFNRNVHDTLEEFVSRGHEVEYEIYPEAVDLIVADNFKYQEKYIVTKES